MSTAVKAQLEVTATITYKVEVEAVDADEAFEKATDAVIEYLENPPSGLSLTICREDDDGRWRGGSEYTAAGFFGTKPLEYGMSGPSFRTEEDALEWLEYKEQQLN